MINSKVYNKLQNQTFIFLDLETSGKYPITSEICEIAALKWQKGEFIDQFQTLIKTKKPMSDEVIKIHHITNDMVAEAPTIEGQISIVRDFIGDGICVAHHAPFDLGFLAFDFEKQGLSLPQSVNICTSLLSRVRIQNVLNHRLQTLVKHFNINAGQAHRALDDSKACAEVFFNCLNTFNLDVDLNDIIKSQGHKLLWSDFSLTKLRSNKELDHLITAVEQDKEVNLSYAGGSRPGQFRKLKPISVVRNPEGDFLVADDLKSKKLKRYFVSKVLECQIIDK